MFIVALVIGECGAESLRTCPGNQSAGLITMMAAAVVVVVVVQLLFLWTSRTDKMIIQALVAVGILQHVSLSTRETT
jgi:hypothetical protein